MAKIFSGINLAQLRNAVLMMERHTICGTKNILEDLEDLIALAKIGDDHGRKAGAMEGRPVQEEAYRKLAIAFYMKAHLESEDQYLRTMYVVDEMAYDIVKNSQVNATQDQGIKKDEAK